MGNRSNTYFIMDKEIKELVLRINDEDARKKIENLKERLAAAKEGMDKLVKKANSGDALTDKEQKRMKKLQSEVYAAEKALKQYQGTQEEVNKALRDLSGASVKELKGTLRALNKELESGNVKRNTAEWKAYQEQIAKTKDEIAEINKQQTKIQKIAGEKG